VHRLERLGRRWTVAIALIVVAALASLRATERQREANRWVEHTHEVRVAIAALVADLNELESQRRGYVITEDRAFVATNGEVRGRANVTLSRLRALTLDNPAQQRRLDDLSHAVFDYLDYDRKLLGEVERGEHEVVVARVRGGHGLRTMRAIRAALQSMSVDEERLLDARLGDARWARRAAQATSLSTTILALAIASWAIVDALRTTREKLRAAEAIAASEARWRRLSEASFEGIAVLDGLRVVDANGAFADLVGLPVDVLIGRPIDELMPDDEREHGRALLARRHQERFETALLAQGRRVEVEARARVVSETSTAQVVAFRDITMRKRVDEALARDQERLRTLSTSDELTGLRNRRGFLEAVEPALAEAERTGDDAALVFCDLDGLKAINDGLGHEFGDAAITDAAVILASIGRTGDVVARLGGDEFVLFVGSGGAPAAERIAERITERVASFNASGHRRYALSMSIGHATTGGSVRTVAELLAEADEVMYAQKRTRAAVRASSPRVV
jgi:diguanylate cyclase (GGDEF)-like protein/PAS domain S-box-containing protein